jgi:hypothetical protein
MAETENAAMTIWAVNPNRVISSARFAVLTDPARLKPWAEKRMQRFDRLPRAVRLAIHEYGEFAAAINCHSRRAADKIEAIKTARQYRLQATAIKLIG